jgi:hypothetical protein
MAENQVRNYFLALYITLTLYFGLPGCLEVIADLHMRIWNDHRFQHTCHSI